MLGHPQSEETRKKISQAMRGVKKSPETIERMRAAQKGRKISDETRRKISLSLKGRKMPYVAEQNRRRIWSKQTKEKRRLVAKRNWATGAFQSQPKGKDNPNFGTKRSIEFRKKCSERMKKRTGEKHPLWIKDRTVILEKHRLRGSPEWKEWRKAVFERDDFTCQECGVRGKHLEPHHIIPLRVEWDKRLDVTNGITLCRTCHQKTVWKEEEFADKYKLVITNRLTPR